MTGAVTPECAEVLAGISAYLDGELETTACDAIERHCRTCPDCATLVEGLRETVGLCRGAGLAPIPGEVRAKAQAHRRAPEDWPTLTMTVSRRIRLTVAVLVIAGLALGRTLETRRLAVALPRDPAAPAQTRLDAERMLLDLQILASDRFQGRATDTPGGAMAAQMVGTRFSELGLSRFGDRFEQPFSFVHRSIRALWRRNRPFSKTYGDARNVVGYVPGTALPNDFIVVSAHFDHLGVIGGEVYHGADDNASGTAALLAIAAWVRSHPLRRSIVFAAFDAEELGLRGSQAFVGTLPFPREHLLLNVNVDMIGRSDDGRLFVSGARYTPALKAIAETAARNSSVPVHVGHDRSMWVTGLIDDWTGASDHSSFHDLGVPFLYFGVEDHADVHQPTDTSDRIDASFYAASAETVLSALLAADHQ